MCGSCMLTQPQAVACLPEACLTASDQLQGEVGALAQESPQVMPGWAAAKEVAAAEVTFL